MKHIKLVSCILVLVLLLGCICGCASTSSGVDSSNAFSKVEGKWQDSKGGYWYVSSDGIVSYSGYTSELHPITNQDTTANTISFIRVTSNNNMSDIWEYDKTTDTFNGMTRCK